MQILNATTESSILSELSYLSADVAANAGSLTLENVQGFAANDYIVIERIGVETAELIKIASITGQILTLTDNVSFAHKKGIKIQKIAFNQRKFYSSSTKTGTYALLTSGTVDIEVDRPDGTFFEHTAGTSSLWYKATYYNETTDVETTLADAIATQGSGSNHYTSIYDIRKQAGFEDAFGILDEVISDYRQEAEDEFEGRIASRYSTPLSSKPKIGRQIVNLLAAGNLLIKEYGMEADIETSKSGARMLDRANELIEKIVAGTLQLIDENGSVIGTTTNQRASCSNTYVDSTSLKGELFNADTDPLIIWKDPDNPRS